MSALTNLFKRPDVKTQARAARRDINNGARDVDREIGKLKRDEAELLKNIKAAATRSDVASAKLLAQQLVRLRAQSTRLQRSAAGLRGVGATVTVAATQARLGASLGTATAAIKAVEQATGGPRKVAQAAQQFARQSHHSEAAASLLDDALGGLDDDVEDEVDECVGQVLDEIGVDLAAALKAPPKAPAARARVAAAPAREEGSERDLDALVAQLAAQR